MVGFDPQTKEHISKLENGLAGSFAGGVTRMCCQPLDVLKIRFQLQVEPIKQSSHMSKYRSLFQATNTIVKEEGIRALWKGHIPAQCLSVVYGFVQFISFEILTEALYQESSLQFQNKNPLIHFLCGATSGCLATIISFPFDVVRTRLVAQGEPKFYKNMTQAFVMILKTEGMKGYFRGLNPTLIQVAPQSGVQFGVYTLCKNILGKFNITNGNYFSQFTLSSSMISGSLAGVVSKIAIYPLDLAKKRLQIQGIEQTRQKFGKVFTCKGLLNCVYLTVTKEKPISLFKGLWPSLLKAAFSSALHFTVYEEACLFIKHVHKNL